MRIVISCAIAATSLCLTACGSSPTSTDASDASASGDGYDARCACTPPDCASNCDAAPPCTVTCHDAVERWFDVCGNEIYTYTCPVGCNDMTSPPHC